MHSNKIAFIDKGKRKTCPTYIENLIDAIIIASNKDEAINEDFIITDGLDITWKEFTDKFADELGLKRPKLSVPFKFAYIIGSILEFIYKSFKIKKAPLITRYRVSNGGLDYTFSIVKAKKILGYQPKVDFETSVKRTVDWYKNR
jgi:nucleoside-diphosphate-sugar epimerase